ncbi:flagellar biosynthesis protein FlgA [Paenibacillus sp. BIHB 4019]|uniref:Flagellar biosynthesis protein FlgA n=1 Tax=Paenibacillus sp. BIHB 4019 TaxID=1870819 RepID=A0A1B2DIV9_9BACL|nr:flagellar biosynthesis protein FlgA [Paenibacillus sp. BIHB 4019]ANY67652.1 flagellar biosynthesis protein FlgA [Paenibacillus sp. BIHB 4019]
MNRRRNIWISVLAALLSGALVYGLFQIQQLQLQRQEMVAVVVPKRFIMAGATLLAEDLAYRYVPKAAYDNGMLLDAATAAGMETIVPLGKQEPILGWKIDRFHLLPGSGESTFQIPRDYVRSISNGIRAGDKVVLYLSGEGESAGRLFDQAITVASVKSSGNVEIDNMDDPNLLSLADGDKEKMYASRREANGMIDYINLNLTERQWLAVDGYCKDGSQKLVIAFSPESLNVVDEMKEEQP